MSVTDWSVLKTPFLLVELGMQQTDNFGLKAQSSFATFLLCLPLSLGLIFCKMEMKSGKRILPV